MDVNAATDGKQLSPLYLAATNHGVESLRVLVNAGARVNARTANGETALFKAHSAEVVDYLVSAGVDVRARDDLGRTALAYIYKNSVLGDACSALRALVLQSLKAMPSQMQKEEHDKWIEYWHIEASHYAGIAAILLSPDLQLLFAIATRQPLFVILGLISSGANLASEIASPHTPLSLARLLNEDVANAYMGQERNQNCNLGHVGSSPFVMFQADTPDDQASKRTTHGEGQLKRMRFYGADSE